MTRPEAASQRPVPPQHLPVALAVWLSIGGGAALGQESPEPAAAAVSNRPAWVFEPSVSLRETVTSNVRLAAQGMVDAVTEFTPQLHLLRGSGAVQGSMDYALTGRLYARNASENTLQQSLAAVGRAELVPRWLFLDAAARIARQASGGLGAAPADAALIDGGSSQVASLQVSPSVQGTWGSWADYEARLGWMATRTQDSPADSYTNTAALRLAAPASAQQRLGWTLDLSHQASRYLSGSSTGLDRVNAALLYGVTPELRLSLRAGRERNDGIQQQSENDNTWGAALRWAPSPRTAVEIMGDRRFFGHSHSLRLEYRLPRSVWSYTDTRDISTDAGAAGGALRTVFDALSDALAPSVADPLQRTALIDSYLQNSGLSRSSLAGGGFLTVGASLQRRQNLTVGLTGPRSTLLLTAYRGRADSVNPLQAILPSLPAGAGARQRGASLSLSHRLTPLSAVAVDASYTRAEATNTLAAPVTSTRSLVGTWTHQLAFGSTMSVAARRSLSDNATSAYNESAIIANLIKRF